MKNYKLVLLLSAGVAVIAQGCSTAKVRVMPGQNGVHQVISKDIEQDGAEEAAMDKANDYCEDMDKKMYVVSEDKTKYNGTMDEGTRKTVRNASRAAMILGGPAGGRAGRHSNGGGTDLGGIVGSAGVAGHVMTNDRDYESKFTFTCK